MSRTHRLQDASVAWGHAKEGDMPVNETAGLSGLVGHSLSQHYERVRTRIHALVAPLSTDQLWTRPYPYGNSVGHLLLHLTGNLSYYIGAQIAGTGYVR